MLSALGLIRMMLQWRSTTTMRSSEVSNNRKDDLLADLDHVRLVKDAF